ncbi:MAG: acyl-CoA thioesterase [Rhodospirillaceae bacterium]|nr:MAG: acyl-CoA thioesterase [Rhodospirillaceae bacterium]
MEHGGRAGYKWWTPLQTRWNDGDPYGHVNNAVYYALFDTAVTRLLFERRVISMQSPSIGLCVESYCRYFAPITFPEELYGGVRLAKIGNKSLRYEVGLFLADNEAPAAAGYFVHVFVDRATRRPQALSEAQKEALQDLAISDGQA